MRLLPSFCSHIIELSATNALKRLMRHRVVEDFRPDYGEDYELPDYAKDWPQTFGNFSLDARGVTWFCDAGDVLICGKGPHATTLAWRELKPLLRPSFALPRHQCFSVATEKYLDNSRLRTIREL